MLYFADNLCFSEEKHSKGWGGVRQGVLPVPYRQQNDSAMTAQQQRKPHQGLSR